MKSKPSTLILILAVILVVGVLVYYFVIRGNSSASTDAGLVSTTSGTASTIPTATADGTSDTGNQVVSILRNLSTIQLSDAVFQNPSFALLTDLSISIPPATNPGRRNPFAPVGADAGTAAAVTTTTTSSSASGAGSASSGGPSQF